eukprot:CAMPEP_0179110876 /NCGR_PEP_ID=MMETSP0796-20121207/51765_1 /TAXON_ID=73915 /ORGANISM="Pyrodinium bahamense, Strain pbaha01" /LENGTH=33 /DNA_ID= /DNA_START= /DNA_END= /DNA_ORIENTATION=
MPTAAQELAQAGKRLQKLDLHRECSRCPRVASP